ncbi:MAG: STAS domain-containing protein [Bryobacteraceae bacterium]|jgi:anti-sigma B factor antagonist
MKIEANKAGKILVIRILEARFGADAVDSFNQQVLPLIREGNPAILLDLSEVNFLDSSGLAAMVTCLKAQDGSGHLAVCGVRESVASLFRLTRMDRILRFFPTSEEGVAALS